MNNGKAYVNIHTTAFPSGEIRGFLTVVAPEPSSVLLMGVGLAGLATIAARRNRKNRSV